MLGRNTVFKAQSDSELNEHEASTAGVDPSSGHVRNSVITSSQEMDACYQVVSRMGQGVVYFGSSRVTETHPHFVRSMELAREAALLLDCTTWSGLGAGLMEAVTRGATSVGKPAAGFKISREGGDWVGETATWSHAYLPSHAYHLCSFFSARKHALVDAGVRNAASDRTAFVLLPGGIGTLDEFFEALTLVQLDRLGSAFPVPVVVMNYDGYYDHMLAFFESAEEYGSVSEGEIAACCKVCSTNMQALEHIVSFYDDIETPMGEGLDANLMRASYDLI